MCELINQEDRRFIATAALPLLDQARTSLVGRRKDVTVNGLAFPVFATLRLFYFFFSLITLDPGGLWKAIGPVDNGELKWKYPRSKQMFYLAAIPLGAAPPLLFVAGLVATVFDLGALAELSPSTIVWVFVSLQVCIGLGFAAMANQVWVHEVVVAGSVWLELDKTIHELGLEKQFVLSFNSGIELGELIETLGEIKLEIERCAHGSGGGGGSPSLNKTQRPSA